MKITKRDLPVMSSWMENNGRRLDCGPYLSGAFEAKVILEKLNAKKEPLQNLTLGGINGLINPGRFSRNWVNDTEHGIPFLSSTDILQADLSNLSLISKKAVQRNPKLIIQKDSILITRSGTIGRMAYCRLDMSGMACTEDVLRVVADPNKILPGYLYAYLSSTFGVPIVISGTYGAIIQHIEPQHIANLPVPRLGKDIEEKAHKNIEEAARLRSKYQTHVKEATHRLFSSFGLKDITAADWHTMGADLGFYQQISSSISLRALNFNSRFNQLISNLSSVNHKLLGNICEDGELRSGLRFKRIDCDSEFGVKLIGQRELFWMEPEGRWIAARYAPDDIFLKDETILIAAQGTLGENEIFCRSELITGSWLEYAYSQHFLRVRSGISEISGAFLFAFLRSETVFRCIRSMSVGSKQQDIHRTILAQFPIPIPPESVRNEIESLVREAYQSRQKASTLEREAIAIVETAIEKGAV